MRKSLDVARKFQPNHDFGHEKKVTPIRTDVNPLMRFIYGLDEKGLPRGDVSVYLGEKTSPEVRDFIRQNLMSVHSNQPAIPAENDADLFEFIREKGESIQDYANRVNGILQRDRDLIAKAHEVNKE